MAKFDESICIFRGRMYKSGSFVCEAKVCAKCDKGQWATPLHSDYSTDHTENK